MGWAKSLLDFWKTNLENNIIRISIAIGAFLVGVLAYLPLPPEWKGPVIILGSLIIMSIFGKNGNGITKKEEEI